MTTAELIKQLQEVDPDGTTDVVIGNAPLISVCKQPAYYDGRMQRFVDDGAGNVRAEYVSNGHKVSLFAWSIADRLWDFPDMEVNYAGAEELRELHETIRKEAREIEEESVL